LEIPVGRLHYATYFDRHYLSRGLAMYRSLARHSPQFELWALCLDDRTHRTLSHLRLDHVNLIRLAELERADPALRAVKRERTLLEYYWTCGPALLLHILERCPYVDMLTYLDADLFFFSDPTQIHDELGAASILLVEMRRSRSSARVSISKSIYNVGLLTFRRTPVGLACLERWREQCLEWCFDRREPDRHGDQKYLEEWPSRFREVAISRHKGVGLGPWNLGNYRLRYECASVWVDDDPLVFYHFARLRVINRWLYDPAVWEHGEQMGPFVKRHVYAPYARELRAAGEMIRAVGAEVDPVDSLRGGSRKLPLLANMVRHGSFLVVSDFLAF
jgi:hypothetical protein